MPRILFIIAALIVYGSLFPFDFHYHPLAGNPLLIMGRIPPLDRFAIRDAAINLALYVPLGAAAFLQLCRNKGLATSLGVSVLAGSGLSMAIELAQIFDQGRTPSLFDVFCNGTGTAVGAWLAAFWQPQIETLLSARIRAKERMPDAVALLGLWIVHQLYPLFPSLSQRGLRDRIQHLVNTSWNAPDLLGEIAAWMAVAVLIAAIVGKRSRGVFALLLLLLPARLLIAGRGPEVNHFAGGLIVAVMVIASPGLLVPRWVAATLLFSLVVRGLAPFHFGRPHGFEWVPFAGTLTSDWGTAPNTLVRKAFDYGAAVWMLVSTGSGWKTGAMSMASLLIVIEVAQQWLPGRTAEITDPLLAILMAVALWSLRHDYKRRAA